MVFYPHVRSPHKKYCKHLERTFTARNVWVQHRSNENIYACIQQFNFLTDLERDYLVFLFGGSVQDPIMFKNLFSDCNASVRPLVFALASMTLRSTSLQILFSMQYTQNKTYIKRSRCNHWFRNSSLLFTSTKLYT